MRLVPIANMPLAALLLALSTVGAAAAAQAPDSVPYPIDAATAPAAQSAARPTVKRVPKAVAKPASNTAAKPAAGSPAASQTVVALPPPRPRSITPVAKEPSAKPNAAKTTPTPDVFAGIGRDERQKLQAALLWSGDVPDAASNDDPMLAAVKNFQKRIKAKVTGQLTADERAKLLAAARDHEREFGWTVVADPATGIRIGLPTKLLPQTHDAAHGTRWSSRHGDVQIETFRFNDPDLKLSALFEREKKEPSTRRVEYSVLHDDNFLINGLQGLRKFSVRAAMRNGEVRGFTVSFDQAMEGIVAPVMAAVASSFTPFPQRGAPFAGLSRPVEYGNGLIVTTQGHIVTDARLTKDCQVIVAAGLGDAERIAGDDHDGLALLRIYGTRRFQPMALSHAHAVGKAGGRPIDVMLAGIPDPKEYDGGGKLTEIKARLTDGNAIELREPVPMAGFTGAAALDSDGHLLGMTELHHAVLASNAPTAPPVRLVRADTIRAFLAAQHVPPAAAGTGPARDSIVRIICVRK